MYKIAGILLCCLTILACKKEVALTEERSFVSVINAVPNLPFSVYVDSVFQIRIPYRVSTRNLQLSPGSHILSIRDSARSKTYFTRPPQEFVKDETSTIVVYDTLHPVDSTVKAIRLSDDLTLAPTGFVKVRFIQAAPRIPAVDVTFVRTSVTPFDSLTFSLQTYIGSAPDVQALSAFKELPIGAYTLKVKKSGTQDTLMNSTKLTVSNLAGVAGMSGITTIYLTGGVQSQPLEINLFRHYP